MEPLKKLMTATDSPITVFTRDMYHFNIARCVQVQLPASPYMALVIMLANINVLYTGQPQVTTQHSKGPLDYFLKPKTAVSKQETQKLDDLQSQFLFPLFFRLLLWIIDTSGIVSVPQTIDAKYAEVKQKVNYIGTSTSLSLCMYHCEHILVWVGGGGPRS